VVAGRQKMKVSFQHKGVMMIEYRTAEPTATHIIYKRLDKRLTE